MNGQTGKITAEIPIDIKKFFLFTLILAIPIFLFLNIAFIINPTKLTVIAGIFGVINFFLLKGQNQKIKVKEEHYDDYGYTAKVTLPPKLSIKEILTKQWKSILAVIISILIIVSNPIADVFHYIAALGIISLVLWSFVDLVYAHNELTTRKLPQLGKRGGDENA